jgi:hypothetical protein
MKAVLDDLGVPWGFGNTEEEARADAIDQIIDLPKGQLREFIQAMVEDWMIREFSDALAARFRSGEDVTMVARGKNTFETKEEFEARR